MPPLTPQQRTRLAAASAAIAALVSVGVIAFRAVDYSDQVNSALSDGGLSRTSGERRVTDLLTEPVDPGASVTTGVMLPLGWRVSSVSPGGLFAVEKETHDDRESTTWYEVTVKNGGPAAVRFMAFIEFSVPTGDGGI